MTCRRLIPLVLACLIAIPGGCGKEEPPISQAVNVSTPANTPVAPPAKSEEKAAAVNPTETATVTGKVVFEGTPPKLKAIDMSAEPHCQGLHPDGAPVEEIVVNPNGTLRNVLVYVRSGLEGKTFAVPAEPVVLVQEGCTYIPHVFGIMVGQRLIVRNADPVAHNIHGMPSKNDEFNFGQSKQGQENPLAFTTPELPIRVKCDVHPWMHAWIGVMPDPFFAVTGADGTFALKGLPPGRYGIAAWHEKLKPEMQQEVTVGAKEKKEITFTFK